MRRADRLFRLTLLLGRGRILTGGRLADRLGVSKHTVYRDIQDLSRSGCPSKAKQVLAFGSEVVTRSHTVAHFLTVADGLGAGA